LQNGQYRSMCRVAFTFSYACSKTYVWVNTQMQCLRRHLNGLPLPLPRNSLARIPAESKMFKKQTSFRRF
jgi:hypothetical protein